jgi:hypothetical protein
MAAHEWNKSAGTPAFRQCGWRALEASEREFLARTQACATPLDRARAPEKLPHPLDYIVFRVGGLTQEHGGFDPSNQVD